MRGKELFFETSYKHNVVCKIVRINKSVVQGEINFAIIVGNYSCLKCVYTINGKF